MRVDLFVPFKDVLAVLDDLHRTEPNLIASQWYASATDSHITLLRREWKKAVKPIYERTLWEILEMERMSKEKYEQHP